MASTSKFENECLQTVFLIILSKECQMIVGVKTKGVLSYLLSKKQHEKQVGCQFLFLGIKNIENWAKNVKNWAKNSLRASFFH